MSRYADGVEPGTSVKQGQVIGYVGSTGYSTGPHCHYEILVNNKFVNPMTIQVPRGLQLTGRQLAEFQKRAQPHRRVARARSGHRPRRPGDAAIIFALPLRYLSAVPKTQRSILLIFEPSRLRLYIRPCGSSTKAMIGLVSVSVSIVPAAPIFTTTIEPSTPTLKP